MIHSHFPESHATPNVQALKFYETSSRNKQKIYPLCSEPVERRCEPTSGLEEFVLTPYQHPTGLLAWSRCAVCHRPLTSPSTSRLLTWPNMDGYSVVHQECNHLDWLWQPLSSVLKLDQGWRGQ